MGEVNPKGSESGQAVVEYLLLVSVIIFVSGAFTRRIIDSLDTSIVVFNGALEKDLRTGRPGAGIWEN